jgi:gluconate 2-dehydrogenase alpha chain
VIDFFAPLRDDFLLDGKPAYISEGWTALSVLARESFDVKLEPIEMRWQNADRWNVAYLQKTTLPYEDNVLDLDPTVKDSLGFRWSASPPTNNNEKKLGVFIQDKMAQWFMEAGAIAVERGPMGTMGPSTHAYGGTRIGDNRETNVVDRFGFVHEVPNLGILGASVMGTSGAHNPTLTAQALAWRTAEHLSRNWRAVAN